MSHPLSIHDEENELLEDDTEKTREIELDDRIPTLNDTLTEDKDLGNELIDMWNKKNGHE